MLMMAGCLFGTVTTIKKGEKIDCDVYTEYSASNHICTSERKVKPNLSQLEQGLEVENILLYLFI